ncbi:MAG: helix-turn-helix transcriptional regulator [Cyanophyceae cyanobacterium]
MDLEKRRKLEAAGWVVGSASDFLELTPEEERLVELRLALSKRVRQLRQEKGLTQNNVASLVKSSQSRVAKLESGDSSVSLDVLIRVAFSLEETYEDLADLFHQLHQNRSAKLSGL